MTAKKRGRFLFLAGLLGGGIGSASADDVLVRVGRLVDVDNAKVLEDQAVVIADGDNMRRRSVHASLKVLKKTNER